MMTTQSYNDAQSFHSTPNYSMLHDIHTNKQLPPSNIVYDPQYAQLNNHSAQHYIQSQSTMSRSNSATSLDSGAATNNTNTSELLKEQERLLPIANISRIMKRALPDSAKMSKEAKAAIQECVSEFIGFITSEASDRLIEDKRKTITGDDVVQGMQALGFDAYMQFLTVYLKRYRQQSAKNGPRNVTLNTNGQATKRARKPNEPIQQQPHPHINMHEPPQYILQNHHNDASPSTSHSGMSVAEQESLQKRQKSVG